MKAAFRLLLYVALLMSAVICFRRFGAAYQQTSAIGPSELIAPSVDPATTNDLTAAAANAATNSVAAATNLVADASGLPATNAVIASTNVAGPKPPVRPPPVVVQRSRSFVWLGLFVFTLIALAGLGAWDFSRYLGERSERAMMAADFIIPTDPDYEAAEAEWTKGNHLDAINLMRGYLQRHPSEQHAAIRIAEIYEKDLNNYLAAALELEEVLTKKLPREKWGWTAVHLANLYSGKLNQAPKALALLERLANDYPDTAAAKKARQRLGLLEPEDMAAQTAPAPETAPEPAMESAAPPEPEDSSNLPKGFRAKK